MGIRIFSRRAEVGDYLATAQIRFDLLREVTALRAERQHHARRIREIDARLAYLAKPLDLALQDMLGERPAQPEQAAS